MVAGGDGLPNIPEDTVHLRKRKVPVRRGRSADADERNVGLTQYGNELATGGQ